ncbi:ribosome maturation factor RimP [Candidatus Omnitrophota bacterium]
MGTIGIPESLEKFITKEAERLGYELVDMSTRGGGGFYLEIMIDKEGGITLDECSDFNRGVSSWIETESLFGDNVTIDVCSPGLDRVLKKEKDFLWAVGKQVKIKTREPVNGKSAVIGKLLEAGSEEDLVVEEEDGDKISIKKDNVAKARLWLA